MSDHVLLRFKRMSRDTFSGDLFLCIEGPPLFLDSFVNKDFTEMMELFAGRLRTYDQAGAAMQRTDREGLKPYMLAKDTVELLRRDPAEAARRMSISVHVPSERPAAPEGLPPVLITGTPVLADSFGDRLYCRRQLAREGSAVECPACGRWRPYAEPFHCGQCRLEVPILAVDERWASIATEDLLKVNAPKFFFPRAWNEGRYWITKEALAARYAKYKEEQPS